MVSVLLHPWKALKKENMKLLVNVREKEDKVLEVIDGLILGWYPDCI